LSRLRRTAVARARLVTGAGLLLSVIAGLGGCGYQTRETFPSEVRSVAVPIFENESFYRGFERDLTEAVIKQIELRTPYKTVSAASAQTELHGVIRSVQQRQSIRQPRAGYPREMEIALTVDVEWRDARTGEVLRSREGLEAVGRYLPESPVSETFETGRHAASQRMATAIVDAMRGDW